MSPIPAKAPVPTLPVRRSGRRRVPFHLVASAFVLPVVLGAASQESPVAGSETLLGGSMRVSTLLFVVGMGLVILGIGLEVWRRVRHRRQQGAAEFGGDPEGFAPAPAGPAPEEKNGTQVFDLAAAEERSDAGLLPILHPMVRRAAERALRKGGPAAQAIVSDGERLYLSVAHIPDAAERERAYELLRRFGAGEEVDLVEALKLFRRLFT